MADGDEDDRLREAARQNSEVIRRARRRAQTEQRRQSEWSKVTLASIGEGVITIDPDGHVSFVNPVAEQLTGWTQHDALGRPLAEMFRLVDEATGEPVENPGLRVLRRGGEAERTEPVLLLARDGTARPIEVTAAPIRTAAGVPLGCVSIFRDVTERRRLERELAQLVERERAARSEAERVSELKEEFLATLSHELRTPLNAILGWIQVLRRNPNAETLQQAIAVLERNARLQSQLIGDMLDMSRILLGKLRLDVQHVDPLPVIEAAVAAVKPAADARAVRLQTVLEPMVGPVLADPARLQQVVWNLLTNAVKFTPKGGRVQVVLACADSQLELSVADTGQGIKPAFLPHVFERFRQADSSAGREHGGLGLGLAIVKQLVELHGGRVTAASDGEGLGATFRVTLPLAAMHGGSRARSSTMATAEPQGPDLRGIRVLVLDDELDARELLQRVLGDSGASVRPAESAAAALALLDTETVDVIVSDIGMRGVDGYAFLAEVRRRGVRTPAAALTAFARAEDRLRALGAGYQMHIAKPVETAELVAAVPVLARQSRSGEAAPAG